MQTANLEEYQILRKEISDVKNCITDYVGFLLGGSSIALGLLGFIYKSQAIANGDGATMNSFQVMGYLSAVFSALTVLVTTILIHKFKTHNRLVAYCRLIAQERWISKTALENELAVGWEWCLTVFYNQQYDESVDNAIQARRKKIMQTEIPINEQMLHFSGEYEKYSNKEVWDWSLFFGGIKHVFYPIAKLVYLLLDYVAPGGNKSKLINAAWIFPRPVVAATFMIAMIFFAGLRS